MEIGKRHYPNASNMTPLMKEFYQLQHPPDCTAADILVSTQLEKYDIGFASLRL